MAIACCFMDLDQFIVIFSQWLHYTGITWKTMNLSWRPIWLHTCKFPIVLTKDHSNSSSLSFCVVMPQIERQCERALGETMMAHDSEWMNWQIDGLVQDCSIFSALAMEILQSCTKPSRYSLTLTIFGTQLQFQFAVSDCLWINFELVIK